MIEKINWEQIGLNSTQLKPRIVENLGNWRILFPYDWNKNKFDLFFLKINENEFKVEIFKNWNQISLENTWSDEIIIKWENLSEFAVNLWNLLDNIVWINRLSVPEKARRLYMLLNEIDIDEKCIIWWELENLSKWLEIRNVKKLQDWWILLPYYWNWNRYDFVFYKTDNKWEYIFNAFKNCKLIKSKDDHSKFWIVKLKNIYQSIWNILNYYVWIQRRNISDKVAILIELLNKNSWENIY